MATKRSKHGKPVFKMVDRTYGQVWVGAGERPLPEGPQEPSL